MHCFIFDFNGTLFLDAEIHRTVWKKFLSDRGRSITDEEFERYVYGPANDIIFRRFFGNELTSAQIDALSEEKEAAYRAYVLERPHLQALAPGASEMLDLLKQRRVPFAVATASIRSNVDFYMHDLGLKRWFDYGHMFYLTGDIPGKPDPAIYRLAMERLLYDPKSTTVVEDSLAGIQSACAAGVGRIIAIDTTLGREALEQLDGVDEIIHDFHGFARFL